MAQLIILIVIIVCIVVLFRQRYRNRILIKQLDSREHLRDGHEEQW